MYISCCASRYAMHMHVCHTHNDQWARMKVCARTQTTTHTRFFELPQLSRRPHSTEMWSISLTHTHTPEHTRISSSHQQIRMQKTPCSAFY